MGRNGSHEVEEGEDDLGAGVRVDAEGDEGRKGVSRKLGIYSCQSMHLSYTSAVDLPFSPTLKSS